MGGWISVVLGIIATLLMYNKSHIILTITSIIVTVGCFWSFGIMHNFATRVASKRKTYHGGFYDITKEEAESVPDWITWISLGFTVTVLVLLIVSLLIN